MRFNLVLKARRWNSGIEFFFVRLQREINNRYATIADETCLDRMFIHDSLASQISLEKNKNHTPPHCALLDPICQMYVSPARTNNANNNE